MFKRGESVIVLVRSQYWPYIKKTEAIVTKVVGEDIYVKVGRTTLMRHVNDVKPVEK